jgi:hypothetical protein
MSKNVGDLAVKLSAQYDNTGIRLMTRDITDSSRMIEGMSASARAFADINPMAAAMSNTNAEMMVRDKEAEVAAQTRREWTERARIRDQDLRDQIQSENIARQEKLAADRALAASDRAYWTERARMRDQALRDETQAVRIAAVEKRNAEIAAQKQATTAHIIETVRRQQADASAQRMLMFDANRPLVIPDGTRGKFGGGNLGSTRADNNMNNRGFVGAMMIQQAGFAVQDFSSQMANAKTTADGLGRGIMAVSNNVQMLGAAFGPTGLAYTAIGGALAGIILPQMVRWVYQADILKDKMADAKEEAREYAEELRRASEQQDQKTAALPGMTTKEFESMRADRMKASKADMQQTEADLAAQTQIIEREQRKRAEALRRSAWGSTIAGQFTGPSAVQKEAEAKRDELREQLKDQQDYFTQLEHVSGETTKKLAENDYELQRKKKEAETKAAQDRLDQYDRDMQHEKEFNEWVMNAKLQAENEKQFELSQNLDAMRKLEQTSNGSSAANIRGTGAAVSAINRAIAGTNSEESDRKKQIKLLEDQLKSSQNIERKLNLQRAAL